MSEIGPRIPPLSRKPRRRAWQRWCDDGKSEIEIAQWIQATYQVCYSLSGTLRLLQRLGCSFHKTTGFLFEAKRNMQHEFVQNYEADRGAVGAARRRYFVDACHPTPD
ncbi:MAG: winged helix-turn-helix domain-containing protein [Isosphaeraceae bacterium]